MIRFVLRLVGALLVEEICECIRPSAFPLVPLGKPDGWFESDYMVGVSGTTPAGVDVSTPLYPGWRVEREGATWHFTSTDPDPYWKDG